MSDPTEPEDIDVDGERGVTITWADGHVTFLAADVLRASCPCADCRSRRERGLPTWVPTADRRIGAVTAELMGNWGLQITWNDGHSTGIYSWSMLRGWCECEECAAP